MGLWTNKSSKVLNKNTDFSSLPLLMATFSKGDTNIFVSLKITGDLIAPEGPELFFQEWSRNYMNKSCLLLFTMQFQSFTQTYQITVLRCWCHISLNSWHQKWTSILLFSWIWIWVSHFQLPTKSQIYLHVKHFERI